MSPTTTLYLVRHGETEHNRLGLVQGQGVDGELNDTGRRQAEALAEWLAEVSFDAVYTSRLNRARQTAALVARRQARPVEVQVLPGVEEMSWGIYEGMALVQRVAAAMDEAKQRWAAGDYGFPVEGGESVRDVEQRARQAITDLVERHAGETVLVVTHGRFIRILLASILPEFGLARMETLMHSNTGVNILQHRDDRFEALHLDATDHLRKLAETMEAR